MMPEPVHLFQFLLPGHQSQKHGRILHVAIVSPYDPQRVEALHTA